MCEEIDSDSDAEPARKRVKFSRACGKGKYTTNREEAGPEGSSHRPFKMRGSHHFGVGGHSVANANIPSSYVPDVNMDGILTPLPQALGISLRSVVIYLTLHQGSRGKKVKR